MKEISAIPRYTKFSTNLIDGMKVTGPDSASFIFCFNEIFERNLYKFRTDNNSPRIIDGGANIGMAIFYWKKMFPSAGIIAIEADKNIFSILEENIKQNNISDITLINKALWRDESILSFYQEGADSGRIVDKSSSLEVKGVKLSSFLEEKVDYLKLDIEGAELEVLREASAHLEMVERIFIEYHSFENAEQQLEELLSILKKAGFRYYISVPGPVQSNPFISVTTYLNMDLQLNIYGVRKKT